MIDRLKKQLKKIPRHIWILLVIILVGTFLRAYNLNKWLDFGDDQVHDAVLVESVVRGESPWPLLGPDMSKSGNDGGGSSRANRFHVGPIYYYFQILSAKVFGSEPYRLAYPDLLFSILSIPLLFYFLNCYFSRNLSLVLTGLYSISFYSLNFSHSAWNPNIIPFFSLLFLFALWKFLVNKEKVSWLWTILLGIALGVGIQLHAILLVLFPAVAFFVFVYLLKNKQLPWKKLAGILLLTLVLNLGQIYSESKTQFTNSKAFLSSLNDSSTSVKGLIMSFTQDVECHAQANLHIVSALGDKQNCSFFVSGLLNKNKFARQLKKIENPFAITGMILATVFLVLGYGLLIFNFRQENEPSKKYFLGLLILYASLSFLVLLPVINSALRYFVHTIFIPFIFLGLIFDRFIKKYSDKYFWLAGLLLTILALLNFFAIYPLVKRLSSNQENTPQEKIVFGETASIADFIIENSFPQKEAYLRTSARCANFSRPLNYIAGEKNFNLITTKNENNIPAGKIIFYVILRQNDTSSDKFRNADIYKNFGQVDIYKITK